MGVSASTLGLVAHDSKSPVSLSLPSPRSWFASYGVASVARSSLLTFLESAIQVGHLTLVDKHGTYHFGEETPCANEVELRVINDTFWSRILMSADLGFSEAYIIGDVEISDLKAVMDLWLDNQSTMTGLSSTANKIATAVSGIGNAIIGQTLSRARLNIIASYDQSNELFKAFLSKEMMYSCALWGEEEGGVRGDLESGPFPGDLEAAQLRKIRHVLRCAQIKPGDRVLEFGSGWGGLAIEAAKTFGCEVDSLTLSKEQKALADERIKEAGLEGRVRIHLMDYREMPAEFEKAFDAFVSVEMLEHVGTKYYDTYFRKVDWALKSKNARAVCTTTTFPESRYSSYQPEDFMRRYMWPNTNLPSATALVTAANTGSQGRFTLEAVENHAAHYPRALREWARRFDANITQEKLVQDFPALKSRAEYDAFCRKWHYLFVYAATGFAKGYITSHMLTFIRENDCPERCY